SDPWGFGFGGASFRNYYHHYGQYLHQGGKYIASFAIGLVFTPRTGQATLFELTTVVKATRSILAIGPLCLAQTGDS
ncbi:MAG: hypothetical protein QF661_12790, partial [Arenicellales bacterium]|nr:hypothetical protein [Arenicellales bacterium]